MVDRCLFSLFEQPGIEQQKKNKEYFAQVNIRGCCLSCLSVDVMFMFMFVMSIFLLALSFGVEKHNVAKKHVYISVRSLSVSQLSVMLMRNGFMSNETEQLFFIMPGHLILLTMSKDIPNS